MENLDEIINESRDSREVKRALSVKMVLGEVPTAQVCALLNVSPQYVSKWRLEYESSGATSLLLGYGGSQSYLTAEQKEAVSQWIQSHATLTPEAVRDYVQEQYGVLYKSPQSYYDLMEAAGWSYHKSEKVNPKRDETLVEERRQEIKKKWRGTGRK